MAEKQLKSLTLAGLGTYVLPENYDIGEVPRYYSNSDQDETNFNAWLNEQLNSMGDHTVRFVACCCYPAVSGSMCYGTLNKHGEGYAELSATTYDNTIVLKNLVDGTWSRSRVIFGNNLQYVNNVTKDIQEQLDEKAPNGFGLGGEEGCIITSANTALQNGWYNVTAETLEIPIAADGTMLVTSMNANSKHQIIYYANADRTICHRTVVSGYFQPWDYENPPMQVGVEYRTTERRSGKTVYAKRISYTATADVGGSGTVDLEIPHGVSSWNSLVRCICVVGTQPLPVLSSSGGLLTVDHIYDDSITVRTYNFPLASGLTLIFDLYYTKS